MRTRLPSKLIAALLAPALLASGAAQALLVAQCKPMSCCKHETPKTATLSKAVPQCCATAGRSTPVSKGDEAQAPTVQAPVAVAAARQPIAIAPPDGLALPAPPPDPLPQRSPRTVSCALLI